MLLKPVGQGFFLGLVAPDGRCVDCTTHHEYDPSESSTSQDRVMRHDQYNGPNTHIRRETFGCLLKLGPVKEEPIGCIVWIYVLSIGVQASTLSSCGMYVLFSNWRTFPDFSLCSLLDQPLAPLFYFRLRTSWRDVCRLGALVVLNTRAFRHCECKAMPLPRNGRHGHVQYEYRLPTCLGMQ